MVKIIVIDDHKMLRDMISESLNQENDFVVVGTASDAKDSVDLCQKLEPDLVLMDVCTENNSNGISYAGVIKNRFPEIKIVIMTGVLDINFIKEAKKVNVDSFIYKNISKDSLISAIKNTIEGYSIYPDTKANKSTEKNIISNLTDKELEVLTLYCKLLDREKVAEKLQISSRTLKSHISSIYQKTGFDNLSKLAIYCVSNSFIVPNLEDADE
ncbi:MAG: response regulator transcription factor [Clostridia bacterium]|nr:response regulator transcription factor [Clostridia bacterium]